MTVRKKFLNSTPLVILLDTGRKLNVHKTFRKRPGCLLNALCTFSLCLVFRRMFLGNFTRFFRKHTSDQLLKLEYAYDLVNGNKSDNNNNTQENQAMIKIPDTLVYSI